MLYQVDQLEEREIVKGFHGKFIHSEKITLAYWRIEEGAVLPEHQHPQEMVVNILEGTFEMVVAGELVTLQAGSVLTIAGNVPHAGRAVTACRILDVFHPTRDEYR